MKHLIATTLLISSISFAQVGIGTTTPEPNSVLHIDGGRVEITNNTDANGNTNTGVFEINNTLRIDGNEIITNTNNRLLLQHDNNGDLWVDNGTFFVDASANRVGVGTTNPLAKLDVRGSAIFNENGGNFDFRIESDTNQNMLLIDASANVVRVGNNLGSLSGNNSIIPDGYPANVTVNYLLDVDNGAMTGSTIGMGSIEYIVDGRSETLFSDWVTPINHLTNDLGYNYNGVLRFWDDVYADGFWTPSDIDLKSHIKKMTYGLNEILKLETISYLLKDDPFQEPKIGLKAQQALKLIPESVKTHNYKREENNPTVFKKTKLKNLVMSYSTLIPVLIKATQEQQKIIKEQEKLYNNLLKRIVQLEKK